MNTFVESEIVLFIEKGFRPEALVGQPGLFLLHHSCVALFEEPTAFLFDQFVTAGVTPSPHTWNKAAFCLKTWFQYCQAKGIDWKAATSIDRIEFRDDFLGSISPHTGELYGAKGVRDTMVAVRDFYVYCSKAGWYFGDIGGYWDDSSPAQPMRPAKSDALVHTRVSKSRKRDRTLPKVAKNQKIRALRLDDLRALMNCVGPQALERKGDMRNCRDRLICDIGFFVGLRVHEIVKLTTLQFLSLSPDKSKPYVSEELTIVGKGGKVRQVEIPTWLVLDAIDYISTERASALANRKLSTRNPPTQLFLGHVNANNGAGRPITIAAVQKMIERACLVTGLTAVEKKADPETGEEFLQTVARYSVHDLRHSYAVYHYHIEKNKGNAEPWKKIQAQLGHATLQLTIDTYLAHVSIFSDAPALFNIRRSLGISS